MGTAKDIIILFTFRGPEALIIAFRSFTVRRLES